MPQTERFPDLTRIVPAILAMGQTLADQSADIIRREAPVYTGPDPERTGGGLRDSIAGSFDPLPDGLVINVGSDKEYARFVVGGTAPHHISPVFSRYLRFYVEGGDLVFVGEKGVDIPAIEPNPFPARAAAEVVQSVDWEIRSALQEATKL